MEKKEQKLEAEAWDGVCLLPHSAATPEELRESGKYLAPKHRDS